MKKRILLLVTLLLMCVLIPLQKTSAQHPAPTLAVHGDSLKTTTTTDTDDIIFTVKATRKRDGFSSISIVLATTPDTITPTANVTKLALLQNGSQDVVVTVPRSEITAAGAGVYSIVFTADEFFEFITPDPSVILTLTVEGSVMQTYGVTVGVQGSSTQTTTTAGTGDITYTLRVTNTGSGTDSITLTKSDVPTLTLSETSLSSLAANAYEDVILTIPRTVLSEVSTYNVTVTATSDGNTSETDEAEIETFVNEPTVYGVTLLNVSSLDQMTPTTDTEDIIYTLKVTNIGIGSDTIELTKEGHRADQITLSHETLSLDADTEQEVTLTHPRSALDVVGTYRLLVTAASQGGSSKQAAVAITTTVTDASIPPVRFDTINLEVVGSLRQTTPTTDTEDVTYTLRVTNTSAFDFHTVDFTVTGDIAAATVSPVSIDLFGLSAGDFGNKIEEVTLTIPRNVLTRGGSYITTVTAVPHVGLSKTVTVRTTVNPSSISR